MLIEKRLEELNIQLPKITLTMANYVSYQRSENTLYFSGAGPLKDGKPVYTGRLGKDITT